MLPSSRAPGARAFSRAGAGSVPIWRRRAPTWPAPLRRGRRPDDRSNPQDLRRNERYEEPGRQDVACVVAEDADAEAPRRAGHVRQSFSHGRSKAVVVETVKRRVSRARRKPRRWPAGPRSRRRARPGRRRQPAPRPRAAAPPPGPGGARRPAWCCAPSPTRSATPAPARSPTPRREEEDRRRAEEEAKRRAEREAREAREREAAEARKREEDERRRQEEERKRRAEDEARRRLGEEPAPARAAGPRPAPGDTRRPRSLNHMGRPAPARATPASPTTAAARAGDGAAARAARRRGRNGGRAETKRVIRRPGMPMKIITPPKTPKAPGGDRNRGRLTLTDGDRRRGRAHALGRRLPPPHAAPDRPPPGRAEGEARARGDDPGDDHHPGARQPHGRARRRRDPAADEAGRRCTRSPT